jgi:uncharacterized membrane protein
MPDTIAGIPLHPLIVHIPVVFIPLTLLAAIAAVAWRARRKDLSVLTAGIAVVGMVGAQLATMSGDSLEERVRRSDLIHQHADLGEMARNLSILVVLIALAFAAVQWRAELRLPGMAALRPALAAPAIGAVLAVLLLAGSGAATVWVVRAGHLGAKAAWHDVGRGASTPSAGR